MLQQQMKLKDMSSNTGFYVTGLLQHQKIWELFILQAQITLYL